MRQAANKFQFVFVSGELHWPDMQYKWGQLSMSSQPQQKFEDRYLKLSKGGLDVMWHFNYGSTKNQRLCHKKKHPRKSFLLTSVPWGYRLKQTRDRAGWKRFGTKKKKQNKQEVTRKPDDKIKRNNTRTPWRNKNSSSVCTFLFQIQASIVKLHSPHQPEIPFVLSGTMFNKHIFL